MDDFEKYLAEQLENPEFKQEWDSHELEYQLTINLMKERTAAGLTQLELAKRSGIRQSNISRIEQGESIPTLITLSKLARGFGKQLQINFV